MTSDGQRAPGKEKGVEARRDMHEEQLKVKDKENRLNDNADMSGNALPLK